MLKKREVTQLPVPAADLGYPAPVHPAFPQITLPCRGTTGAPLPEGAAANLHTKACWGTKPSFKNPLGPPLRTSHGIHTH